MEVHAHTHTERKKWTHYLWEFLMLFLAVFCGFLAENQREHIVEHKREKQYIKSMTVDLAADTTKLGTIMRYHEQIINGLDSILTHYDRLVEGKYSQAFFKYQKSLDGFIDFIYTDRTIDQLKSSGGMRLIRKQAASDSIVAYDDDARDFLLEQEGLQRILNRMTEQRYGLINYRFAIALYKKDPQMMFRDADMDLLLTHDKEKVESFYNTIYLYRSALYSKIIEVALLYKKAVRLIAFLKDQYNFK